MNLPFNEISQVQLFIFNQVGTHSNRNNGKIIALSQTKDEATWSREGSVTLANVTCILKLEPVNLAVC